MKRRPIGAWPDDPDVRWPMWLRKWVGQHLGFRGLVLFLIGIIYLGVAASIPGANDFRAELPHTHLPTWVRICLWLIPGLVALVASWDGKYQGWGFAGLFVSPANRVVSYGAAFAVHPSSAWDNEPFTPLPGLLVYTVMALLMLIMAAWPEPTDGERVDYEVRRAILRHLGPEALEVCDPEPLNDTPSSPEQGDTDAGGDAGTTGEPRG